MFNFLQQPCPRVLETLFVLLFCAPCLAGRPMAVDDANVDDVGTGHVETWYARQSGNSHNVTVAPGYGLADGIEIDAALSRADGAQVKSAVQAKFLFTESNKAGCNLAGVIGLGHGEEGNSPYLNGIVTCNMTDGAAHFNLGAQHPAAGGTLRTWGVSYEHEFGAATGHVEYFGQQQDKPTAQFGLRSEVSKNIQLDGTLGRSAGETLYSLGMKFMF